MYFILFIVYSMWVGFTEGVETNPKYYQNTDFLQHESGNENLGNKRDYVASQFPVLGKPLSNSQTPTSPSQVNKLINFYENNNNANGFTSKPLSYSSIVRSPNNQQKLTNNGFSATPIIGVNTLSSTRGAEPVTRKPNIPNTATVAGNKFGNGLTNQPVGTNTQNRHSLANPEISRPGINTHILPSSILNQNQRNQVISNQENLNEPTDTELQNISEELLRKDNNNAAKYIIINYQGKTTSFSKDDKASMPLLTISDAVWKMPTIQKFVPLLDNYERDTLINEHVTPQERIEENAFMDAIMSSTLIRHLMNFLKEKGYVSPDPKQQRDFLKQMWFGLYSRGKGKISSSAFEHIFVSELKNGEVSGLHNWIYFSKEESQNRVNYLGYLKYAELGDKGAVLKLHFNQQGLDKPVDSLFVGTSPELEIALYTLCFVTRADRDCKLRLEGKNVNIVTHSFRYRSKNMIGSAYPQI